MTLSALRRFAGDRKGSVAVMFGLAPLMMVVGLGLDYTSAAQRNDILDAAAHAAALAALAPGNMTQASSASVAAATSMFNARAVNVPGLNYQPADLTVTAIDDGLTRTVTVSYTASSQNGFASVLGERTWPLNGRSQASASVAP